MLKLFKYSQAKARYGGCAGYNKKSFAFNFIEKGLL
jgi:hypothetical protein